MRYEPIIRGKFDLFKQDYGYSQISKDKAFEYFVNYNIIESHQPEAVFDVYP